MAAAHAGCFTMAVSAQLGQAGLTAESLETTCTISLEKQPDGFAITESHLELKARVPGASQEAFDKAVPAAKTGCPVSKLFKTNITLNAKLARPVNSPRRRGVPETRAEKTKPAEIRTHRVSEECGAEAPSGVGGAKPNLPEISRWAAGP